MALTQTGAGPLRHRFETVPLYQQVMRVLMQRIAAGEYRVSLPAEGDLARELGVSSGTVRKALDALEAEGVLERRQGRGTFVREQVPWEKLPPPAAALAQLIGAVGPAPDAALRSLVDADGKVVATVEGLECIATGARELLAWLERQARLAFAGDLGAQPIDPAVKPPRSSDD